MAFIIHNFSNIRTWELLNIQNRKEAQGMNLMMASIANTRSIVIILFSFLNIFSVVSFSSRWLFSNGPSNNLVSQRLQMAITYKSVDITIPSTSK